MDLSGLAHSRTVFLMDELAGRIGLVYREHPTIWSIHHRNAFLEGVVMTGVLTKSYGAVLAADTASW